MRRWTRARIGMLGAACLAGAAAAGLVAYGLRAAAPPAPGPVRFRDVAGERGLHYRWGPTGRSPLTNLDSFGHGCALLDYDGDGRLDALLVGEPRPVLYRGEADGRFRDVSRETGLSRLKGAWRGCAVGDVNGDGRPDIYLTGFRCGALLIADGAGGFRDTARTAGLSESGWGSSAALADLDGDGDLDLIVGHYVRIGPDTPRYCTLAAGVRSGCPPSAYDAERAALYENDGAGRFRDVTRAAGLASSGGKTLALSACDYDGDGRLDLYLANDGVPANLYRGTGGLRFEDVALAAGAAFGNHSRPQAGMGADWADFDRDGAWDLAVTAFSRETYSLYRREGGFFMRVSDETGLAAATHRLLGFGVRFLDFDLDGWPDLAFANGHVYDRAEEMHPDIPYRQPTLFLRNRGGRFEPAGTGIDASAVRPIVGRGLASGDFDNDGLPDLLVVDREGTAMLLRNETPVPGRFLGLRVEGPAGPAGAAGARVTAYSGKRRWLAQVAPYGSYLSSSDERVLIGLGEAEAVDAVEVQWPDGARRRIERPPVGTYLRIAHPRRGGGEERS